MRLFLHRLRIVALIPIAVIIYAVYFVRACTSAFVDDLRRAWNDDR